MALQTPCQTPGTVYHTSVRSQQITLSIDLPKSLDLGDEEATVLEANLHNAVELVLARYFS